MKFSPRKQALKNIREIIAPRQRREMLMLVGRKFNRLKVMGYESNCRYKCKCDCGATTFVKRKELTSGRTKSCGCFRRESFAKRNLIHGHARVGKISREYRTYRMMLQRCSNPRHYQYPDYGGRGIFVCKRWKKSFVHFFKDMGSRPLGKSLDRINNDKGYKPSNCRWATPKVQNFNKRSIRKMQLRITALEAKVKSLQKKLA